MPLGVDEVSDWCNSLQLVPKPKGKAKLYLNPAKLNQAVIRPMHGGPTTIDISLMLTCLHYLTLTDVISRYHSLTQDEELSYPTSRACQFGM